MQDPRFVFSFLSSFHHQPFSVFWQLIYSDLRVVSFYCGSVRNYSGTERVIRPFLLNSRVKSWSLFYHYVAINLMLSTWQRKSSKSMTTDYRNVNLTLNFLILLFVNDCIILLLFCCLNKQKVEHICERLNQCMCVPRTVQPNNASWRYRPRSVSVSLRTRPQKEASYDITPNIQRKQRDNFPRCTGPHHLRLTIEHGPSEGLWNREWCMMRWVSLLS